MTWVLVLFVYAATSGTELAPGDPGILMNSGHPGHIERVELIMPSQEACQQAAALSANASYKPECWAKPRA